jgi:hypothetical protein
MRPGDILGAVQTRKDLRKGSFEKKRAIRPGLSSGLKGLQPRAPEVSRGAGPSSGKFFSLIFYCQFRK